MTEKKTKKIYKKELKKYVKQNIKRGFDLDIIKTKLMSSGINQKIIEEIILDSKKKQKKAYVIFVFLLIGLLASVIVFFYQNHTNNDFSTFKVVQLIDYSECLNFDTSRDRYYCYSLNNKNRSDVYVCGWYFIEYETDNVPYTKRIKEGEIIFKVDGDFVDYNTNFQELLLKKRVGDTLTIKTNKDTYKYEYLPDPHNNELAHIYIYYGRGFCLV